jgi:hypothetical protein
MAAISGLEVIVIAVIRPSLPRGRETADETPRVAHSLQR